MLSDFERRSLREMERRLSAEDPDFVRGFAFPDHADRLCDADGHVSA